MKRAMSSTSLDAFAAFVMGDQLPRQQRQGWPEFAERYRTVKRERERVTRKTKAHTAGAVA